VAVVKRYYSRMLNGIVNAFIIDAAAAYDQAYAAGDIDGHDALHRLWLDHFESYLGKMSGPELVAYLRGRQVWQREAIGLFSRRSMNPASHIPRKRVREIRLLLSRLVSATAIRLEDVMLGGGT
jgi:hypothetical protein